MAEDVKPINSTPTNGLKTMAAIISISGLTAKIALDGNNANDMREETVSRTNLVIDIETVSNSADIYFDGKEYKYFNHHYNDTKQNERAIEIPIVNEYIKPGISTLEIGNVLANYYTPQHKIIDLLEKAPNVINEDVSKFHLDEKFDLIFSISTLEHIGYNEGMVCDDPEVDPEKIDRTMENIHKMLSKKGRFIFTIPINYNKELDNKILNNHYSDLFEVEKMLFLNKNREDDWQEASWNTASARPYNMPPGNANGIIFCILKKKLKRTFNMPGGVTLSLTYNCNSRCMNCNIWKMEIDKTKRVMSADDYIKLWDSKHFNEVGLLGISGGEATMHPQVNEIIS